MTDLELSSRHRFAFGSWTNGRRWPFGESAEPWGGPRELIHRLSDIGGWGISVHDDELAPPDGSPREHATIVAEFRAALDSSGIEVCSVTSDLARHPAFADGSFTSADRDVRRYAIAQAIRGIDLGAELGAEIHSIRFAPVGMGSTAARSPAVALERFREAINFLCGYVREQGCPTRFALETNAAEPGYDDPLPTAGHALAFINTLDDPELVGLSPDAASASETRPSTHHGVAQALWSDKLFHIELAGRGSGHHGRGHGFCSDSGMDAFLLVKLLEDSGYAGPLHFTIQPGRVDDAEGMCAFASGCMRTYLALAAKARRFAEDPDIQEALTDAGAHELAEPTVGAYTRDAAMDLAGQAFDPDKLAALPYRSARLDRLVTDLLLGLR